MKNKQLIINMISQIVGFLVNMGISFLLTPFIVNNIGKEAYGFVGLANDFVGYAQIVTVALNSMAGTFITIKIHQNDNESANKYFTSVVITNIFLAIVMTIPSVIIVLFIDKVINIPQSILLDVQILWALMFFNFIISIITSIYGIATFARNRLDLSALRNIESNIIKIIVLILMFKLLTPSVWYIGLATVICTMYITITNIIYTIKLLPEIRISLKYYDFNAIKELLSSGIWNVFNRLSQILNTGLDLLLTNICLGSSFMGILSISKTIPKCFILFTTTIVSVFSPQLTISYAENNIEEVIKYTKQSIRIMTVFTSLFFAFIVVYAKEFYSLWVPKENAELLYALTILSVFHMPITSGMNSLYNIFTVTNKLKKSSLILMMSSIINAIITIISANVLPADTAIYIVAGTSSFLALMVAVFFVIPYAAICLNLRKGIFISDLIFCIINNIAMIIIFIFIKCVIPTSNWIHLILAIVLSGILGLLLEIFVLIKKDERKLLINKILRR